MPRAPRRLRLAVLISGRGSNMLAIAEACAAGRIDGEIVLVLSDEPAAAGLESARARGLRAECVDRRQYRGADGKPSREAFEAALRERLDAATPDLVILAGFMRVLSAGFVDAYACRMLNIHPSLLPAYKGLHTHERALADGVAEHGVSVHFVTAALDGGPVVLQARVPVLPGDTPQTLSARVQREEHIVYPQVIQWIAEGRLQCADGSPIFDGAPLLSPLQLS
jgi:phosphoribosylglycinamide formyltransferase-1